jgi:hypothetical protein
VKDNQSTTHRGLEKEEIDSPETAFVGLVTGGLDHAAVAGSLGRGGRRRLITYVGIPSGVAGCYYVSDQENATLQEIFFLQRTKIFAL